jgi:1-acyl-sn-glycerol-3-phosphate acyltransferase
LARFIVWLPVVAVLTAGMGLVSIATGAGRPAARLPRRLERAWARTLLRMWGVHVTVRGAEHVPRGPAVYAANHVSALDIPLLFGYLPAEFRIVHKRSLYLFPIIGIYLYLSGHIAIDRGNPFRARRSLARAAARIAAGESVAMFPEGTRSRDGRVLPFKKGSFVLALEAGVPVVPVSLCGVPRLVAHGLVFVRAGAVAMVVHAPLETRGASGEYAEALAERCRTAVAAGCA